MARTAEPVGASTATLGPQLEGFPRKSTAHSKPHGTTVSPRAARKRPAPPRPEIEESDAGEEQESSASEDNGNGVSQLPMFKPPKTTEDFWIWLSQWNAEHWQYLIAYVWRTAPIHNRRTGNGRPMYIWKYACKFDQEQVLEDNGSGGYRIDLCGIDPGTGKQKRICQHYFEVMRMDKPPKLPPGDWIQAAGNEDWAWCGAALNGEAAAAAGTTAPAGQDNSTVMNLARQIEAQNERMARMTSPDAFLDTLAKSRALFAPATGNDQGMIMVFELLKTELSATRSELAEVRKEAAASRHQEPRNLKLEIAEMAEVIENVKKLNPRGHKAGDDSFDWAGVAKEALPHLALITQAIVMRAATPPPQAQQQAAAPGQWPNQPPPQQAQQQPASDSQPPQAQPIGGESAMSPQLQEALKKHQPLLTEIMPFLIDHFKYEIGGGVKEAGAEFQVFFLSRHGRELFDELRKDLPAAGLLQAIGEHALLRTILTPASNLAIFIDALYAEPAEVKP